MQKSKPQVLIFTDWFAPGFKAGGPIKSLVSLTTQLRDLVDFSVITSDRDLGDTQPYPGIVRNEWMEWAPGVRVAYLSPEGRGLSEIKKWVNGEKWDVLYLNSMFSIPFTLYPIMAARLSRGRKILAPRGMLHAGALSLKKWKKKAFLQFFKLASHHRDLVFQATNPQELLDIRAVFGAKVEVVECPNLPSPLAENHPILPKEVGRVRLVFVGRVSPVKNLHFLLERLASLPGKVNLDVIGPLEDSSYVEFCRSLVSKGNLEVQFHGPVVPEQIPGLVGKAHFLVSPSLGENFGHAIWEALSCGKPALISDQTPWKGLESENAGFDLPLDRPDLWTKYLSRMVEMGNSEYAQWSQGAWHFAQRSLLKSNVFERNIALFCAKSE